MRIVFMGTPDFAEVCLKRLYEAGHDIAAVYSKPDMPKNRGMKLLQTPVKEYALTVNLPVIQPATFKNDEVVARLKELEPDVIVVVAYGKLLPQRVLDIPRYGCINVHASLLPKYRGSAPIQWSILNGDTETGVTAMLMDATLDTGNIISTLTTTIDINENSQQLWDRLGQLGAELICNVLSDIETNGLHSVPQGSIGVSEAPMLKKEMSPIDWSASSTEIHCKVRGLYMWPVASAAFNGKVFKIYETELTEQTSDLPAGTVAAADKKGILVVCGDGKLLRIKSIQAQGGKRMAAADYLRGHPADFEINN